MSYTLLINCDALSASCVSCPRCRRPPPPGRPRHGLDGEDHAGAEGRVADHLALSELKQGLGGFRCRLTIGRRSRAGAGGAAGGVGLLSETGVRRLGDALFLGPVVVLEGVPLGAADFAAHFQQLVGDLLHKAGGQIGRGPAEEHPLGGAGEVEAFLRAGQGDVAQAAAPPPARPPPQWPGSRGRRPLPCPR